MKYSQIKKILLSTLPNSEIIINDITIYKSEYSYKIKLDEEFWSTDYNYLETLIMLNEIINA